MVVGRVLVARRHAIPADDGTVHDLSGHNKGGKDGLRIPPIEIGIMKQPLTQQHIDIGHFGKIGPAPARPKRPAHLEPILIDPELARALPTSKNEAVSLAAPRELVDSEVDAELLDGIREAGVAVNEPDRAAFVEASRAVYDEFAATVEGGGPLVERATAAGSN